MNLGKTIKLVRTAAGVRQSALARQVDVTPNYLSLIETGKREPSVAFLRRLAAALGVPVAIFFSWQDASTEKRHEPELLALRELLVKLEVLYLKNAKQKQRTSGR